MLIQLRQSEIEEALKMYVTRQGFSLAGKHVDIAFTASRGNNGITADLDITDALVISGSAVHTPVVTLDVGSVGEAEETPVAKESPFEPAEEAADLPDDPEQAVPAVSLFAS